MISCPPADHLEAFLDEYLDASEWEAISSHVSGCSSCQAVLDDLTETPEKLRGTLAAVRRSSAHAADPNGETGSSSSFLGLLKQGGGPVRREPRSDAAQAPTIAGYEVLAEVGRGGMGVVYRALHVGLNRTVALKMILAGAHAAPRDLARFRQEAEAVARLHHPNIVDIYDIGEAGGRPYFAMEFVEGGSLVQFHGRPQPPEVAAQLIETLARAVHFAHRRGIVHRDLKPANILLQKEEGGRRKEESKAQPLSDSSFLLPPSSFLPKITDFGLAKRLDGHAAATVTGEVVGTPAYMAPEQAGGKDKAKEVGPPADVYALGAILYELLTGRPPFKGATALETVLQVLYNEPVRPARLQPSLPRDLDTVCLKCLEKDPARRYGSAEELANDLHRFLAGDPVRARPVRLPERAWKWARRRPIPVGLLASLVLVALLGFAGVTWQWRVAVAEKSEKGKESLKAVEARNQARVALYHSRISQSQLYWRLNDFAGGLRTLNDCRPELRGWEWHYLRGLYASELLTFRHPHKGKGGAVAIHPHRSWVASLVSGQKEVRIWDGARGTLVFTLPAAATASRLAFRPDGTRLAVADREGWVTIHELATRREVHRHRPHERPINDLAYSADGRWLATASVDGTARVWDTCTGTVRYKLGGHTGQATALAFSPDGRRLATADQRGKVYFRDLEKKDERPHVLQGHKSGVYGLAYSPDGQYLASAGSNGTLRIWKTAKNPPRLVQSLARNAGAVLSVAFSPDGRFLAYGGSDATVRLWHWPTGVQRMVFRGHTAAIESVRFTPDGRRLVSCCPKEGTVKVWDLTRHPEQATLARTRSPEYHRASRAGIWPEVRVWDLLSARTGPRPEHTGPDVEALAFQQAGQRLVSVTVGGKLQIREADSGLLLDQRRLPFHADLISPALLADFAPGGQRLATCTDKDRLVRIWNVSTGQEIVALRGSRLPVFCVRFSANGKYLAAAGCDRAAPGQRREVLVWNTATGALQVRHEGRGHPFNLAFSPDHRWLAIGSDKGRVQVMDWASGQVVLGGTWHRGAVTGLAFNARREGAPLLVTAGAEDRAVRIWDCGSGKERARLKVPGLVCDLTFSPDGQRLAGICRDRVKLWDVETGQELLTLRGAPQRHHDPAFNPRLAFSPDGRRLAGSNWDESISVWEANGSDPKRQQTRRQAAERRAPLWHLEEAEHCMRLGNRGAAAFHLRQLGQRRLPWHLQDRKENLSRQLSLPGARGGP